MLGLRLALRTVRRSPGSFALLQLILIIGCGSLLLTGWFGWSVFRADTFYKPSEHLYMVADSIKYGNLERTDGWTMGYLAPFVREEIPQVEQVARYRNCPTNWIRVGGEQVGNVHTTCVESSLFELLSFPVVHGDPAEALRSPEGAVISRSLALRLFGTTDAVGEQIEVPDGEQVLVLAVGAVIEDIPGNTHIQFELARSLLSESRDSRHQNLFQYMLLREGEYRADVETALTTHVTQTREDPIIKAVKLIPFKDVFLSDLAAGRHGNMLHLRTALLLGVALFLVSLVSIFSLRLAGMFRLGRRLGIRKAMGAGAGSVFRESFLSFAVGVPVTMLGVLGLVVYLLPGFNQVTDAQLVMDRTHIVAILTCTAGLVFVMALLQAALPVIAFRKVGPRNLLSNLTMVGTGPIFRRTLIGVQVVLMVGLVTVALLFRAQFNHLENLERAFRTDGLLIVELLDRNMWRGDATAIQESLLDVPGIESVSLGADVPGTPSFATSIQLITLPGGDEDRISPATTTIDTRYLDMLDIPLIAGRTVSSDVATGDTLEVVINEHLAARLGFDDPRDAVGYSVSRRRVVGVIPDFHYATWLDPQGMLMFQQAPRTFFRRLVIATNGPVTVDVEEAIQARLASFGALPAFNVQRYEDRVADAYAPQRQAQSVVLLLVRMTFLLAFVGLVSVAAFLGERRIREFGVRKVLGASLPDVWMAHARDFVFVLVPGFIVGALVGFQGADRWLSSFVERPTGIMTPMVMALLIVLGWTVVAVLIGGWSSITTRTAEALRQDA